MGSERPRHDQRRVVGWTVDVDSRNVVRSRHAGDAPQVPPGLGRRHEAVDPTGDVVRYDRLSKVLWVPQYLRRALEAEVVILNLILGVKCLQGVVRTYP